uniref:Uncharacterized protein n=1 Tax=Neisseria meningitidis alpha275 TaxID=295996 RepID=C6SI51_NEIME|nr:hypothetical protein predicted by Glimmer/Critica [Neisseria meningitidis alpha275]
MLKAMRFFIAFGFGLKWAAVSGKFVYCEGTSDKWCFQSEKV